MFGSSWGGGNSRIDAEARGGRVDQLRDGWMDCSALERECMKPREELRSCDCSKSHSGRKGLIQEVVSMTKVAFLRCVFRSGSCAA